MRFAITAMLIATAAPAIAQDHVAPREDELAARLNDPMVQAGIAAALAGMVGTVLDTRVGPLAALDPEVRPRDTLRDLNARRGGDPYPEARVYRDTRAATARLAGVAGGIAAMMPELRATADRLRTSLDAIGDAGEPR